MGGGAGIQIEVTLDCFTFTTRNKKQKVDVLKWDALGYMDGMRDIRGDLLKATAYFEITPDEREWLKSKWGIDSKDTLTVSSFKVNDCIWGGYIRGTWDKVLPLTIEGTAEFEFLGGKNISVELRYANKEDFREFWLDVFGHFCAEEGLTDDDGNEYTLEQQYEDHEDDNRANYGAH